MFRPPYLQGTSKRVCVCVNGERVGGVGGRTAVVRGEEDERVWMGRRIFTIGGHHYRVCICGGVASDVPVDATDLLHNGQKTSTMRVETFYIMFSGS